MQTLRLTLLVWVIAYCATLPASQTLDNLYALKKMVCFVVNSQEEPVYAEHVENVMIQYFKNKPRFEFSDKGYIYVKERLKIARVPKILEPKAEKLQPYVPLLKELAAQGVDGAMMTEILPSKSDNYKMLFILVNTANAEIIQSATATVDNRYSLETFASATRQGVADVIKGVPFDASIVSREGYRVIIDRGFPDLYPGLQLPAFTIENGAGEHLLEETGMLILTKVEDNISFGKIILDKKPLEVNAGNKIQIPGTANHGNWQMLTSRGLSRGLASIYESAQLQQNQRFGYVDVNLAGSMVSLTTSPQGSSNISQSNVFYPGGNLSAHIFMTNHLLFDFGFSMGMAVLTMPAFGVPVNLNSSISEFRGQIGYQFWFNGPDPGPIAYVKAGFVRKQFSVDPSPDPLSFTSSIDSGVLLTGGAEFPLVAKLKVGFDINTLIFGLYSETPYSSGTTTSNSAWDFKLHVAYSLNPVVDVTSSLAFALTSINFNNDGNRPITVLSSSQTSTALQLGLSYYF